ncbi:DUF4386 domain-containing protein [Paracrocinitomix mangrovi]|uniref:DUF4386 domain-containing protein n=1 Tax=Paracrocinitomix mangrovi TaxID=2862509 RepID=UPI001C8D4667|nr:DUF4386 domain-containing protein [Paracrocinitomix mangrovi]UKN02273.1 DUF4386 domain-containing protein [Paracrocinitomix mangrovi]
MDIKKKTRIAGLLILVGMICGIFSVAPAVDSLDYLTKASEESNQTIMAAIFQLILSLSYIGFAILIYSIIKDYSKSHAVGFMTFRVLAVSISVIGIILLLSTLRLSEMFEENTLEDSTIFSTIGEVLKYTRDVINHIFMVFLLCIGNIILYLLFYKTKILPRWMSVWGIGAAIWSIFASVLVLIKVVDIITLEYLMLNVPTAIFELLLGVWLLVKGFNKNKLTQLTTK